MPLSSANLLSVPRSCRDCGCVDDFDCFLVDTFAREQERSTVIDLKGWVVSGGLFNVDEDPTAVNISVDDAANLWRNAQESGSGHFDDLDSKKTSPWALNKVGTDICCKKDLGRSHRPTRNSGEHDSLQTLACAEVNSSDYFDREGSTSIRYQVSAERYPALFTKRNSSFQVLPIATFPLTCTTSRSHVY